MVFERASHWYRLGSHLGREAISLLRVARGVREDLSVGAYLLRYIASRRLKERQHSETTLRLRRMRYRVALGKKETLPFTEIYLDRVYDRLPEFEAKPGWVVLDAGANIGVFAVQQAQLGARVFAFEPNPDCYRRIHATVAMNRLGFAIRVLPLALGRTPGTAKFTVGESNLAGSIVDFERGEPTRQITVVVETLDEVVGRLGIGHIDLLKVDVEWAEMDVLLGARRILPLVDRVVLEYHSHELLWQAETLLTSGGFAFLGSREFLPGESIGVAHFSRALHPALTVGHH